MSSNFNANFVENNFFSDEDWASQNLNVTLGLQDSPECPDNDTESLLTNWSSGSSTHSPCVYLEHENETNIMEFNVDDLLKGVESPPLTPPEDKMDMDQLLMEPVSSDHIQAMSCEELLNGLSDPAVTQNCTVPSMSLIRGRSNSNESSSTSAYSSQSATPPPKPQAPDGLENLFFGATSTSNTIQTSDEGFHEVVFPTTFSRSSEKTKSNSRKTATTKARKPVQKYQKPASIFHDDVSDFDRKVEEALKETNRLLNMHQIESCVPTSPSKLVAQKRPRSGSKDLKKPGVDLRQLCDRTILHSEVVTPSKPNSSKTSSCKKNSRSSTKQPAPVEAIIKELKRKALESVKSQANGQTQPSAAVSPPLIVTNTSTLMNQTCQISLGNTIQAPLTCTLAASTEPPVKIIVKQEQVPHLYLATSASNNTPVTILRSSGQNIVGRVTPSVVSSPSATATKKAEIPLHSLVIKPEKSTASIPLSSLNITNCQPAIKVVHNPSLVRTTTANVLSNNAKSSCQKSTSKPLMVSQPAKKPIVPNGNAVYPSSLLLQGSLNSPNTQSEPIPLNSLNAEAQGRVLKRQQRMIKNREWACQSRQRRKEYMTMLEQQMHTCVEENNKLRTVNAQLKDRISELEKENATLRSVAGTSNVGQRKTACILMLVLFIGFNVNPLSFSNWKTSSEMEILNPNWKGNNSKQNWPIPDETGYHGRQLLALADKEVEGEKSTKVESEAKQSKQVGLHKLQSKQEYWIDDMVKSYKKEHISKILAILHSTSPVPLQRLLRRKLKEELGLRFPLSSARNKRISYTPSRRNSLKTDFAISSSGLGTSDEKTKLPPPSPTVKNGDRLVSPCDRLGKSFDQPNETDSTRVSDNLAKWIEQHEVQQREIKKSSTETTPDRKSLQKSRRRRRNSTSSNSASSKSSIPVIYEKRDQKLKRLLEAIDRKNDTVYMISFSKDHILLPASVLDASGHTKMSIMLPTVPPNDSFVNIGQGAMIQINCEVHSTNYVRVDRELLAGVGYPRKTAQQHDLGQQRKYENPKRKAFHGSKTDSETAEMRRPSSEKLPSPDDDATVTEVVDL